MTSSAVTIKIEKSTLQLLKALKDETGSKLKVLNPGEEQKNIWEVDTVLKEKPIHSVELSSSFPCSLP